MMALLRQRRVVGPMSSYSGALPAVVWDPATKTANCALSNGNLTCVAATAVGVTNCKTTTSHTTGKYYAEFLFNTSNSPSQSGIGVIPSTWAFGSGFMGSTSDTWGGYSGFAVIFNNGVELTNFGHTAVLDGQRICIAFDLTNSKAWWRINGGTWNTGGDPAAGTGGVDISSISGAAIFIAFDSQDYPDQFTANFGATAFTHTAPSGFGNW